MNDTRSRFRTAFVLISLFLASVSTPPAAVLVVSQAPGSQYPTIQLAIDAAVPGQDEVSVTCGTYIETVTMRDGVHVRGVNPRCAVLQGPVGSMTPTVTFPDLVAATELSDLTVRADSNSTAISGGSGPVIITHNILEDSGFGIFIEGTGEVRPSITRNIVRDNAEGIFVSAYNAPPSSLSIANNLVVGTSGYIFSGTGIIVEASASVVTVANNTIVGNIGGIYVNARGGEVVVANNAVKSNTGFGGIRAIADNPPRVERNVAWANAPYDYYSPPPPSNRTADPMFLNENPDFLGFEPDTRSPLVDSADPQWAPVRDIRGARRVSGLGHWNVPDIGARENEGLTRVRWQSKTSLTWDAPSGWFFESEILRGDLRVLRETGVWRQDTSQVPAAERFCEMAPNGFSDSEVPAVGEAYFYLVAGWPFQGCETTLGFMSGPQLRSGYVCWSPCPVGP